MRRNLLARRGAGLLACSAVAFGITMPGATIAQSGSPSPVRGVVRAVAQASIGIDLPLRVTRLYFREADSFRKGDVLVTFDCKRMQAEHAAAAATSREMKLGFESQKYLEARGAVGKLEVEISKARAEKAAAEAEAIASRLDQCSIVAPFDGRITDLRINEHEVPPTGQAFISLVDESRFEIDVILPSQAVRNLDPGAPFQFRIDETGITHDAKLLRIGAVIDPVSQSIRAIGTFVSTGGRIIAGMSGSAHFAEVEGVR